MLKAFKWIPPWIRPLLYLGAVGIAIKWLVAGIAIWVGARSAPWWWNALGLPTGEEEEDNGSEDENGDEPDPEEGNGDNGEGVHGGNGGGGQVPFDSGLVAVGAATLAEAKLQQQAATDALARSRSK